jgi:L-malate glycosyltransferase
MMRYRLFLAKRWLEDFFIFPFILIGRLCARAKPQKTSYRIYFFFSFYHIGGAEKVHAQVATATGGPDCIIYFTRKSHNDLFRKDFEKAGCVIRDISAYTDNKWLYFLHLIYRGIISSRINRQSQRPMVFNGQCNFGYKISPWVNKKIPQVELIHSLNSFSYIRIPFLPFITKTVMISKKRIEDHRVLYDKVKIPPALMERIQYIPNAVTLPTTLLPKPTKPLIVLFVGRGGVEKRVHLIAAMAERLHNSNSAIQFQFLGDVSNMLDAAKYPYIIFHGNQGDGALIASIYQQAAIVILVSSTEGFPMVVIEGMAYGAAIVATPVGDIPHHVLPGVNGYLVNATEETRIIEEGVMYIQQLYNERALLEKMQAANRQYAIDHFGIETFNRSYRALFDSLKPQP